MAVKFSHNKLSWSQHICWTKLSFYLWTCCVAFKATRLTFVVELRQAVQIPQRRRSVPLLVLHQQVDVGFHQELSQDPAAPAGPFSRHRRQRLALIISVLFEGCEDGRWASQASLQSIAHPVEPGPGAGVGLHARGREPQLLGDRRASWLSRPDRTGPDQTRLPSGRSPCTSSSCCPTSWTAALWSVSPAGPARAGWLCKK